MTTGIDVSNYQGAPDWRSVLAAGFAFAYVKATEGIGYISSTLDSQFRGATDSGMIAGLYHFGHPDTNMPEDDADAFATAVNAHEAAGPGRLPPCLDLEVGTGDLSGWTSRFITRLRAQTGTTAVMVYSGSFFFRDHIGETWMDPDCLLWIADYGPPPGSPSYLTPRVAIHQYASDGSVPGIAGNVDLNWTLRPLADITALPGGIETMGFNDQYTDWAGNQQTVQSWMNHLDQRIAELHSIFLDPGEEPSRIPGDTNRTNLRDMIMDAGAWTNQILVGLSHISDIDETQLAANLGPMLAQSVQPAVQEAVTEALGEDNTNLANDIVSKIGAKLSGSTAS